MSEVDLFLEPGMTRGISRALYDQIRGAIGTGRLAGGDRLPPTRELAAQLGISRQTVTTVYGRLAAEGFIEGHAGGGSLVSRDAAVHLAGRSATRAAPASRQGRDAAELDPRPVHLDLRPGTPDPGLFPLADWRRCIVTALQQRPSGYGDPAGSISLRGAIAQWIGRSRSVAATADRVIVTAGAQQAIYLVLRTLVKPGQTVAMEDPGYAPVRTLCSTIGATTVPVPVDSEGIVVERIPPRTRVVYTTPSHQFPLGVTMSLARRRSLLAHAQRHGMMIIEDDYDTEYRHVDRPVEPLSALDHAARVVYVGTFSKTLSPSLRLGFAVLPDALIDAAVELRQQIDVQPPEVLQHGLERFIVDGLLDRHLRRTRKIYTDRHRLVVRFVGELAEVGHLHPVATSNAGLHVSALLGNGATETRVLDFCRQRGVAVGGLGTYWAEAGQAPGLVIGFGSIATTDILSALEVLAEALRDASTRQH